MTSPSFTLQSESGETFGQFPSHKSAHAWLVRHGLEWEPLSIVSIQSVTSRHNSGWIELLPLHLLARPSLAGWRRG